MSLELGAQIPAWHWGYGVEELRDWCRATEAIGYDFVYVADHVTYAYPLPDRPAPRYAGAIPHHEALTLLSAVSVWTSRVRLQTSVLVLPQRDPVLVAKQAAEVDVLSGGRLRLGVGIGWAEAEFAALGVRFADRASRFEEAIGLLRACWREEPVSFAGAHYRLQAMSLLPKPVTPGGPPIIVGAAAPRALRRAARLGDGWAATPNMPPEDALAAVAEMRELVRAAGRDPESFSMTMSTPLASDAEAVTGKLVAYREAGFDRLGLHIPSFDAADAIPMDAYIRRMEVVHRDVWPSVLGAVVD